MSKDMRRHGRMESLIGRLVAEFLSREALGKSLLTVTRVTLSEDNKYATIFFSVFPENFESEALVFIKRRANDVREYIQSHARMGHVSFLRFTVDTGEKNRQKIESLSKEIPKE